MGSADLVPGVSGGTIALVVGIYERLVESIRQGSSALGRLLRLDLSGFRTHLAKVEWALLIPLLVGILTAVVALASLLETLLHDHPTIMAGFFLGLVVGSIVIAWRLVDDPDPSHYTIALGVGATLFLLLGLGDASSGGDPSLVVFFGAGALAICAMILPGISGSLILLLLGMYEPVLGAVNDRDLTTLGVVAAGAVVGLALFSQLLGWALRKYHAPVIAALVGLMAGSLRVLWPWPGGVEDSALGAPASDWPIVLLFTLLGVVVVFAVARLAENDEQRLSEPLIEA